MGMKDNMMEIICKNCVYYAYVDKHMRCSRYLLEDMLEEGYKYIPDNDYILEPESVMLEQSLRDEDDMCKYFAVEGGLNG